MHASWPCRRCTAEEFSGFLLVLISFWTGTGALWQHEAPASVHLQSDKFIAWASFGRKCWMTSEEAQTGGEDINKWSRSTPSLPLSPRKTAQTPFAVSTSAMGLKNGQLSISPRDRGMRQGASKSLVKGVWSSVDFSFWSCGRLPRYLSRCS